MDARHFEALSRRVAHLVGRRSILYSVLVAPVATGVAFVAEGEARRKRKKKSCKRPQIKCGKKCLAAGSCCTNADCTTVAGQICVASACTCAGGQVVEGNACATPCSPACEDCQRCDDGTCVTASNGTRCFDGGTCRAGVCKPDLSLGCAVAQDSCAGNGVVECPDSSTNNLFCFVDADGDPVCGSALCTNDGTGAACPGLTGNGSIVLPCAAFCVPVANKTHMCVKP